jgi:hypothetical protein
LVGHCPALRRALRRAPALGGSTILVASGGGQLYSCPALAVREDFEVGAGS